VLKTVRCFYEEFFSKIDVKKGSNYIDLVTLKIIEYDKRYNELKSREANNRSKGFKVVYLFFLEEPFNNLASFEVNDLTLGVTLSLKDLATLKRLSSSSNILLINLTEDTSFNKRSKFFVYYYKLSFLDRRLTSLIKGLGISIISFGDDR